ncbi:unknown [Candidatus Colimorpha enterica]|uniref:Uncharacterized protein n=1 Tax=Candidatus Colimorpha enterica TaxID=3083063 RepID=R6USM3_9BACT|nr:unknown [Candidatus Colimorpha enterica]
MKKLLYVLVAVIIAVSCFTVAVSADDGRTLTVVSVTEKSITFKYTGAKAGDNNWVGVYTKDASVTPDAQSETSSFYVYLADGDGEYTIEFDKCLYTRDNKDTYAPGSFWRNVENPVLADKQENYKLLWLGGASWYETLAQAALPAALRAAEITPPPPTALLQSLSSQLQQQVLLFSQRKSTDRQIRAEMPRIIRTV